MLGQAAALSPSPRRTAPGPASSAASYPDAGPDAMPPMLPKAEPRRGRRPRPPSLSPDPLTADAAVAPRAVATPPPAPSATPASRPRRGRGPSRAPVAAATRAAGEAEAAEATAGTAGTATGTRGAAPGAASVDPSRADADANADAAASGEDEATYDSLTDAVFLFEPTTAPATAAPQRVPFPRYTERDEPDATCARRQALYETHWARAEKMLLSTVYRTTSKDADQIYTFLAQAHEELQRQLLGAAPSADLRRWGAPIFPEIPTALLFTETEQQMALNVLETVRERLDVPRPREATGLPKSETPLASHEGVGPGACRFAILDHASCLSFKVALKLLVTQLMFPGEDRKLFQHDDFSDDSDDEADAEAGITASAAAVAARKRQKLTESTARTKIPMKRFDLRTLAAWYRATGQSCSLVITIPQIESFPTAVLAPLLQLMVSYTTELPFVLVLGVATTWLAVQEAVPAPLMPHLRTVKFYLQSNEDLVEEIVERLFLEPSTGLALGGGVYTYLYETYRLRTLSLHDMIKAIHFAYMDHYYGNPLAWLTHADPGTLAPLSPVDLMTLQGMPSYRQFMAALAQSDDVRDVKRAKHELDPAVLSARLPGYLEQLQTHRQLFRTSLLLLLDMARAFTEETVGSDLTAPCPVRPRLGEERLLFQTFFRRGLENTLASSVEYQKIVRGIRLADVAQMEACMAAIRARLAADLAQATLTAAARAALTALLAAVRALEDEMGGPPSATEAAHADPGALADTDAADLDTATEGGQPERKPRVERPALKAAAAAAAGRPLTLLSQLPDVETSAVRHSRTSQRTRVIQMHWEKKNSWSEFSHRVAETLDAFLDEHVASYQLLPFHELVYYDHVARLQHALDPPVRANLHVALSQPSVYEQCTCCPRTKRLTPTTHDTSIAYHIYLEGGRILNVYDWFKAFESVVSINDTPAHEHEYQARFIRSLAELQFMGYIKFTKIKTDHVVRLTWGH